MGMCALQPHPPPQQHGSPCVLSHPSQVQPYVTWDEARAAGLETLHWSVVAWAWSRVVRGAVESKEAFMLVQASDPAWFGRMVAWWPRPPHLLYADSGDRTKAEVRHAVSTATEDPHPSDPTLLTATFRGPADGRPAVGGERGRDRPAAD